jgi:segregation and condensation protein A
VKNEEGTSQKASAELATQNEAEVEQHAEAPSEAAEQATPFTLEPRPIAPPPPEPKRPSAAKEEASQSPFSVTVG